MGRSRAHPLSQQDSARHRRDLVVGLRGRGETNAKVGHPVMYRATAISGFNGAVMRRHQYLVER